MDIDDAIRLAEQDFKTAKQMDVWRINSHIYASNQRRYKKEINALGILLRKKTQNYLHEQGIESFPPDIIKDRIAVLQSKRDTYRKQIKRGWESRKLQKERVRKTYWILRHLQDYKRIKDGK